MLEICTQCHQPTEFGIGRTATAGSISRVSSVSYLIFDNNAKCKGHVIAFLKATGLNPQAHQYSEPCKMEPPRVASEAVDASLSIT
jgi:hypothetical protein